MKTARAERLRCAGTAQSRIGRYSPMAFLRAGRVGVLYLLLLGVALFNLFPLVWMILTSFKSPGSAFRIPPEFYPDLLFTSDRFENYRQVLVEDSFIRYSANSFFIAAANAVGQVATGSLAGFAFARMRFRGANLMFALLLGSAVIPTEVTIIPEFLLVDKLGWLETYLPLIVPSWLVGTLGTLLFREFFSTIPDELSEAASVDGANAFRIFWSVYLPLSKPAIATLFLIAFINAWNELLRPVLYVSEPTLRTVTIGLTSFQSEFNSDWELLMAASVVTTLPLIILYIVGQRWIVESIATRGLKG